MLQIAHKFFTAYIYPLLLCLKTLMVAPERRKPNIREAWFFSSLNTKHPGETILGKLRAFVANPMPNTIASSTPRNLAVVFSSST